MQEVNRLYKALNAYEQYCADEDTWEPTKFSYFVELAGKPQLREFVGMSDDGKMSNETRFELYEWIEEPEDGAAAKIPAALDVRKLPKVLKDPDAYDNFLTTEGNINTADAIIRLKEKPLNWKAKVKEALHALQKFPAPELEGLSTDEMEILERLRVEIGKLFELIAKVKGPVPAS